MSLNFFPKLKQKPFGKILFKSFRYTIIFILIALMLGVGILSGTFFAYVDTAGEISPEQLKLKDSTSVIYDISGNPAEYISGSENRQWVDISKIPIQLQQAFIAIEDERFYQHNGIDFRRIAGAAISYFIPGSTKYGASTITQQVVKNLTGDKQVSLKRKIQEWSRALQLEQKLSKEQILELYLNIVPLSEAMNGVQSGAKAYFDKDVSELDLAECADIAGITNWPTSYDPFIHPDNNKQRQEVVLGQMKKLGYITDAQYQEAVNEKLNFKKTAIAKISNHSYFADQVINDVIQDLQYIKGYSETIAEKMVYGGGLKIYTTMDSNVQKAMEDVYTNPKNFVHTNSSVQPQSAMAILDPKTGQIRGLVGGVGPKQGQRTFNRATQAYRQPGSSFKPIAVYGPAIDANLITPYTVLVDEPININGWEPHNYDDTYSGSVTVKYAITHSINVIAVKILERLGLDNSMNFLNKVGIKTLTSADRDYAPLALGALSKGVSPLQMASAYVPFSNKGVYIKPCIYLKVVDNEGNTILENTSTKVTAVMSEKTADTMTKLLENVVTSGTGTRAKLSKMPTAGKTGTAADMKDKWFVGYTPYYVGAVWYGYDTPQALPSSTWNSALDIWKNVMEEVHANLPPKDFGTDEITPNPSDNSANANNVNNTSSNNDSTNNASTNNTPKDNTGTIPDAVLNND